MPLRTPSQVAERAIVMGAVALRASLEVTDHPRTSEVASQIPNWLASLDVARALDPIEHELLNTSYGQLDESQRVDANWSGEGAAVFCWTLGIGDQPPLFHPADQAATIRALRVMHSGARELLAAPSLRPRRELEEYCKNVRLVRMLLREAHVYQTGLPDEKKLLATSLGRRKIHAELADIGIEIGERDFEETQQIVSSTPPEQRRSAAGVYVARDIAVTWLFDSRSRYFDQA